MTSTLNRYLLRQNLILLGICMLAGVGIFLLVDVLGRIPAFVDAQVPTSTVVFYFLAKIPSIISQLLPAFFLIGLVIQLSLMRRYREIMALETSGISFGAIAKFVLLYALCICLFQLLFSQVLGVWGNEQTYRIWKGDVRKKQIENKTINNLWFKEGRYIVEIDRAWPRQNRGEGITLYHYDEKDQAIASIIKAGKFTVEEETWVLTDVSFHQPRKFASRTSPTFSVHLDQDLENFLSIDTSRDTVDIPIWRLTRVIQHLKTSGSNVEWLETSWHMRWSYAFSVVIMGLFALAFVSKWENIYVNIVAGLITTFAYYSLHLLGMSSGQKGLVPPMLGAWTANLVLGAVVAVWLVVTLRLFLGRK